MGRSLPSFFLTKKKLAAYELHDGRIVFHRKCSSTNFFASAISSCVRGNSRPGRVLGAPRSSSMAWSHTVCLGSCWDSCSEKIFACC